MFQILAAESPNRVSLIEDSKGESSDSKDDLPLSSALVPVRPHELTQQLNSYPQIPEDSNSETEVEQSHVGEIIMKAIDTVDSTSTERQQNLESASEIRLMRTILERLECSFARQEAKLDQLLQSLNSQSLPQQPQQPQQVSTPDVGTRPSSVEYPFRAAAYSRAPLSDHGISSVLSAAPLFPEVDRFLEDVYPMDREVPVGTVPVGGCRDVRLEGAEYDFAKAAEAVTTCFAFGG
ncbi:uncharacterized protein [Montipora foliosa]|uniref:uncharacterized protein isoform X2 n=1 Tax=Montipora foliosa TaxID=591990 RepID=UPI0035F1EA28